MILFTALHYIYSTGSGKLSSYPGPHDYLISLLILLLYGRNRVGSSPLFESLSLDESECVKYESACS